MPLPLPDGSSLLGLYKQQFREEGRAVRLVSDKATNKPAWSEMYTRFCHKIME